MNTVVKHAKYLMLAFAGALLFLTSCATSQNGALGRKFQEEDAASLVVRYSTDSTIFRVKPAALEGEFYKIFSREELCDQDARRPGDRGLAVVVIGYIRYAELERQIKQGWVDDLTRLHYRQVVFLRGADEFKVNGLRVVDEMQLGAARVPRTGDELAGGFR